jgi:hypothetical protein
MKLETEVERVKKQKPLTSEGAVSRKTWWQAATNRMPVLHWTNVTYIYNCVVHQQIKHYYYYYYYYSSLVTGFFFLVVLLNQQ